MKTRLVVGLLAAGLMTVMMAGAVTARSTVEQFLGPEANGNCDTLELLAGDRVPVGLAKVRYTGDGDVLVRLHMRNLAPDQLHRVLLHQQGDPYDPGYCNFSDVHHVTTDSRGRLEVTLDEPAIAGSAGLFVTVYAAAAATDLEAFSSYPIYGTEAIHAPE